MYRKRQYGNISIFYKTIGYIIKEDKMRKYRNEIIEIVDSVVCDRCGREDNSHMEIQEYLAVDFVGGYNSVFGDMEKYTGDFCQRCVKAMMGNYLTKIEEVYCEQDNVEFLLQANEKTKNIKSRRLSFGCQRGD